MTVKMSNRIRVYRPHKDNVTVFDSANEFNDFYEENKDEIDQTHTRTLNCKYKINGFKITRQLKKIVLVPVLAKKCQDDVMDSIEIINEKIDIMNKKYELLEKKLNKVLDQLDIED